MSISECDLRDFVYHQDGIIEKSALVEFIESLGGDKSSVKIQKRKGGRPKGSGKYGEPSVMVRVPVSLSPFIAHILEHWNSKPQVKSSFFGFASALPLQNQGQKNFENNNSTKNLCADN